MIEINLNQARQKGWDQVNLTKIAWDDSLEALFVKTEVGLVLVMLAGDWVVCPEKDLPQSLRALNTVT